MMLERLATLALFLSVACGSVLLVMWLMELYDQVVARVALNDVDESLPEPEGFEDFWDMVQKEWDFEGEALPPATCTAADWCAGRPADGDTRCCIHITIDQGRPA